MEDPFESFADPELQELVHRFQETLSTNRAQFFDLDEFEDILEYALFHHQPDLFNQALDA